MNVSAAAASIAAETVKRLRDVEFVDRTVEDSHRAAASRWGRHARYVPYHPGSLNGSAGVALAQAAAPSAGDGVAFRQHLARAFVSQSRDHVGLHDGTAGLVLPVLAGERRGWVSPGTRSRLHGALAPSAAMAGLGRASESDLISGSAGVLLAGLLLDETSNVAEPVLRSLGIRSRDRSSDQQPDAFLPGMAHGMHGMLPVLAKADVERAPAVEDLLDRAIAVLGPPRQTGAVEWGWCYGPLASATGALHLAARLRHDAQLERLRNIAASFLEHLLDDAAVLPDAGLCHGWSGVLEVAMVLEARFDVSFAAAVVERAVSEVVSRFEPAAPFGYRASAGAQGSLDEPGLLSGAAGVALALHDYLARDRDEPRWGALALGIA